LHSFFLSTVIVYPHTASYSSHSIIFSNFIRLSRRLFVSLSKAQRIP
jgi:hypothetical protein